MADCYGCPYRWHDEDCEYCGAQGDMILDGMSIKKENCPYYIAYMESRGKQVTSSSSSSSSYTSSSYSSSSFGCGVVAIVLIGLMVLGGIGIFFLPTMLGVNEKKTTVSAPVERKTAIVYNVNSALNMREAASQDSKVITTVPKGEKVIILEEGTDYHYVQYGEHEGYCAAECLEIQE